MTTTPETPTDLTIIDVPALTLVGTPEGALAEAQRAARALKGVLDKRPHKVILNGHRFLEFEDWTTIARFYDVRCRIVHVAFVEYPNGVRGFTAHAEALRADGSIVSAAQADCLTDEPKWRARPKYVTEHGRRVQRGEEPIPMHQLKSMAQTRAGSKTLRMALSWVVILAGYKPTPAEEMDDRDIEGDEPEPVRDVRDDAPRPKGPQTSQLPAAARLVPPIPTPVATSPPERAPIGTITDIKDIMLDGIHVGVLVTLATGFVAGTRNVDLIAGLKTLRAEGIACELVTRAPSAPGRAPTIVEVLSAPKEATRWPSSRAA